MSKQIIKRMNKDIDYLYTNHKDEIKDLCQIQKRTVSIMKPTVLFVIISLILCFQIYQVQLPSTSNQVSQHEIDNKNIAITESQKKRNDSYKEETNSKEKTLTQINHSSYTNIYILIGIDIFIIIYIFIKKSNKT